MKFQVTAYYSASTSTEVELPINSWDEIECWYIKWNTFYYQLKGEDSSPFAPFHQIELEEGNDIIDWKRPSDESIYKMEGDEIDYEHDYSEL